MREAVNRFGRAYAASWGLAVKGDDGTVEAVAEGEALIALAFGNAALRRTEA